MAPKAKPVDKSKQAAKQKAAEDKTFGLKNKNKSAKVQKYVQTVTQTAASQKQQRLEAEKKAAQMSKKQMEEAKKKELADLLALTIKQPKVPAGVDPKSILCEFFKHGQCTKGFKCKFSHDKDIGRKTAKIDLFTDKRDLGEGEEGKEEGMEDWDQETLEKVVKQKHGAEKPSNATTIICKYFLEAVEKRQYGWFWKCPNGPDCKYRHALPPGYVLKSQMKELLEEEAANRKDVTEEIEEARKGVQAKTPVTQETFRAWQSKRMNVKRAEREAADEARRKKGVLNGREIFLQEGFVAADDASASGAADYTRDDEDEARIQEMFEQARRNQEAAAARAAVEASYEEEQPHQAGTAQGAAEAAASSASGDPGPSSSGAAAGASGTHLQLNDDEAAELFDDDDDDDDEDLDALEASIQGASLS